MQLDIVEYDTNVMMKPRIDIILGSNTMKELVIILNFLTKDITLVEISLTMRDINKLKSCTQIEKSWAVNNIIY